MSTSPSLASLLRKASEALSAVDPTLAEALAKAAQKEAGAARGMTVARFLDVVVPLMPTLALPPKEMRTKAWYGKVGTLLKRSGLTEELATELARKVASWSTQDMSVEILISRSAQYLSQREGREGGPAGPVRSGVGPRPMFTDEETQD